MDKIEEISKKYLGLDEFIYKQFTEIINKTKTMFPRYGSFILEFLQNADDAKAKKFEICVKENKIEIFNDGNPFTEKDVESICCIFMSSKKPGEYIGYLGFGFKSVFLLSNKVEIYSGDYKFKFDKQDWGNDKIPYQIIPIKINDSTDMKNYNTKFNIYIEEKEKIKLVEEELSPQNFNKRVLLFLPNVEEIIINDEIQKTKRIFYKEKIKDNENYKIFALSDKINGTEVTDYYLVYERVHKVSDKAKRDRVAADLGRTEIEERKSCVVFKLDEKYNLIKEEKGVIHMGVYSFLPLKESIPLNFLIHGDFISVTRGEVLRDSIWNIEMAKEVFNTIKECVENCFLKDEKWKWQFIKILCPQNVYYFHPVFGDHIVEEVRNLLKKEKIIISRDNELISKDKAVLLPPKIREYIKEEDIINDLRQKEKELINPKYYEDEETIEVFKNIGVTNVLNDEYITPFLMREKIQREFLNASPSDKLKILETFFMIYKKSRGGYFLIEGLKESIKLPVKGTELEQWVEPEELFLPKEYMPVDYDLEEIIKKGYLKEEDVKFVDPRLIEKKEDTSSWRSFLEGLGVGKNENRIKELIEKIAMQVAMKYEKTHRGKFPQDVSKNKSWDIETNDRIIEVKGTKEEYYGGKIKVSLSGNEYNALMTYPKIYYIYRVFNTLRSPYLIIIPGEKIEKEEMETKIVEIEVGRDKVEIYYNI